MRSSFKRSVAPKRRPFTPPTIERLPRGLADIETVERVVVLDQMLADLRRARKDMERKGSLLPALDSGAAS